MCYLCTYMYNSAHIYGGQSQLGAVGSLLSTMWVPRMELTPSDLQQIPSHQWFSPRGVMIPLGDHIKYPEY